MEWADPRCRGLISEFVPMIYSLNDVTHPSDLTHANGTLERRSRTVSLLGMNEPSEGPLKNESAADVASRWHEMEALANRFSPPLQLGAPAPGGLRLPHAVQWLTDFFGNCTACRVDFVAVHWYRCDGRNDASAHTSARSMMSWLDMIHTTFKREVWLTEFNCGDGAGAASNPLANQSASNHLRFMRAALPLLDASPVVARYSWFQVWQRDTPEHPGHNPGCSLVNQEGTALTELGRRYNQP